MFSVCMRYARDRGEAEDLLQEGFMTVFTKICSFNALGSLEGWMRKVFVTTALMKLRKGDVLKDAADMDDAARMVMSDDDILAGISGRDIVRIISGMPDGFKAVFNMSVIEGFSHTEIAERLGISEGTSRSQLSRARTWLQEKLQEWRKNR